VDSVIRGPSPLFGCGEGRQLGCCGYRRLPAGRLRTHAFGFQEMVGWLRRHSSAPVAAPRRAGR